MDHQETKDQKIRRKTEKTHGQAYGHGEINKNVEGSQVWDEVSERTENSDEGLVENGEETCYAEKDYY